jgi:hypothetical protein
MLQADRIPRKRRCYYHVSSWPLYFTRYVLGTEAEQGFMVHNCEVMEGDPGFQTKVNVPLYTRIIQDNIANMLLLLI